MGSEYYYNIIDLAANPTGYNYKWLANDTSGNWGVTPSQLYTINKNTPNFQFLLNSTNDNYTIDQLEYVNMSAYLLESKNFGSFSLLVNSTEIDLSLSTNFIENIPQFNIAGIYNITCTFENQNFTLNKISHWLTVTDIEQPVIIHFANLTHLNCTLLEYQHTSLEIHVNVSDNVIVSQVFLCENTTGMFVNRSIINHIDADYWIVLNISILNYGETFAYCFYANDTDNLWGKSDNSSDYYKFIVYDFINPDICEIDFSLYHLPDFVLESTLFTIFGGNDFEGSGISHYQYKIDNSAWIDDSIFNLAGNLDGNHTLYYRAVDMVGNNGTVKNVTIYLLANYADYDRDGFTNGQELRWGTDLFNPFDNPLSRISLIIRDYNLKLIQTEQINLTIFIVIFSIGTAAITSTIYLKWYRPRAHRKKKEKHNDFLSSIESITNLDMIDGKFNTEKGESKDILIAIMKKQHLGGIFYKDSIYIPDSILISIEKSMSKVFNELMEQRALKYIKNKVVDEVSLERIEFNTLMDTYSCSKEELIFILEYLIKNKKIIGYIGEDAIIFPLSNGIKVFLLNILDDSINIQNISKNFIQFEKFGIEIINFISENDRPPEREEAWKLGIPFDLINDVMQYLNIKIEPKVYNQLLPVERQYFDQLSSDVIKELEKTKKEPTLQLLVSKLKMGIKDAKLIIPFINEVLDKDFKAYLNLGFIV